MQEKINMLAKSLFAMYEGYSVYYRISKDIDALRVMKDDLIAIYKNYIKYRWSDFIMKISAVHMDTILADVNANMVIAKRKILEAVKSGAELVLFPEFFTSGFAFTPKILDVVVKYENPQIQLSKCTY